MFIVIIGPPGAGKGTQAKRLTEEMGLIHLSTGDIFRENINNRTELGVKVKKLLDNGILVSDELTIEIVKDRLIQLGFDRGAIFDGFPRNVVQAQALDDFLRDNGAKVSVALSIEVQNEVVIDRLTGRRTDVKAGRIYHVIYDPPPVGVKVEQRADDIRETVEKRLSDYYETTVPIIEYYKQRGILSVIDGNADVDDVTENLVKCLSGEVLL